MRITETVQTRGATIDKGKIVDTLPFDDEQLLCKLDYYWITIPKHLLEEMPVGYMRDSEFVCPECTGEGQYSSVYLVNVKPYSQTCHKCGKLIVDGFKTDGKPLELFAKGEARYVIKDHTDAKIYSGNFRKCMDWLYRQSLNYNPPSVIWDSPDDGMIVAKFGQSEYRLWKS
jgi:hypothetical protein